MAKECPEKMHQVNLVVADKLAAIHQGKIAGKEVKQLFVDPGATLTVVRQDHIPPETMTGERIPVAPFNGAPPSTLQTAIITIEVGGWQAEREVAVAEKLRYDTLLGRDVQNKEFKV